MSGRSTWISLPRHVVVGNGVISDVVSVLDELPVGRQVLIVTSATPREVAGDSISRLCVDAGMGVDVVEIGSASFGAVDEVVGVADGHDVLLGVGGGSVIDVTKLASVELSVPYLSIPTAASHDGIVSSRGSIPDDGERHSVKAEPPSAVVADTSVITESPWELTTAGYADIVSNYTAVLDWELAHRVRGEGISRYACALARMTAETLVESGGVIRPGDSEAVWLIVKALVSSGVAMSIAGSSRPASGAEHLFSHRLDEMLGEPALHGHQVGVGTIVVMYLHGGDWEAVRSALDGVGAPTTVSELGVSVDDAVEALATAHSVRDRYTVLGDGMGRGAAREALMAVDVV